MKIGIAGVGVVGGTLANWLRFHTQHEFDLYDPALKLEGALCGCDAVFICVPAPTLTNGDVDLSHVEHVLEKIKDFPMVFIRSTVPPGTTDKLEKKYGREMFFMPEFLTERTATQDFDDHLVISGSTDDEHVFEFLAEVFNGKKDFMFMSNVEAEICKYAHNVLAAVNVNTANIFYRLCEVMGADYNKVRQGFLSSGLLSPHHNSVPGHDGKFGYGGKCLPKDAAAIVKVLKDKDLNYESLGYTVLENAAHRMRDNN